MSTYVIGDVQGCFDALVALLETIKFDKQRDTLWFTGDLVNRGPKSLETLRFVKSLGDKHITVLGNHDLHLLAVAYGVQKKKKHDTLKEILQAEDREDLLDWLRTRPIMHTQNNVALTHAGLAPDWTLTQAISIAREVEMQLQSDQIEYYLLNMYGNTPNKWDASLHGVERFRCAVNYFTRMRFCHLDGSLDLEYKGTIEDKPDNLFPWFELPDRQNKEIKIIFGHWAALDGKTQSQNLFALDTGCVWGRCLTAMRLEDELRFSVKCHR